MQQEKVSIDVLKTQKSHIDLSDKQLPTDFGLNDYVLTKIYDDVVLVEYADIETDELGNEWVTRNGIAIPVNQVHNAWRKGKVILVGPNVRYTEIGDIVVFPNNMGIGISNLEVKDYGRIRNGLFLNEQRMFGVCESNKK